MQDWVHTAADMVTILIGASIFWQLVQARVEARRGIKKIAAKLDENTEITRKTELSTNSMKDALVAATAKASHAEGVQDERSRAAGLPLAR